MSLSNTTENATLKMHLQGTDPSYRAGATQYLAMFTGDPGETASLAAEADYTGYARVAVGEGVEKKEEDFAAEVAKMVQG